MCVCVCVCVCVRVLSAYNHIHTYLVSGIHLKTERKNANVIQLMINFRWKNRWYKGHYREIRLLLIQVEGRLSPSISAFIHHCEISKGLPPFFYLTPFHSEVDKSDQRDYEDLLWMSIGFN